ncbi:hypothetical protein UCRPA7_456 [Phaeoacremonium minimum UCRPA7]|uniref:Uncharacterized protein n=1 Tax=Phaeoacremonium minimum (strain UCR-PA7) TaxID=1286976 RepID=R8BX86_PHAM7|nr:hypothetical protein UCRPA7_456 [Phaeoacremonium minimum UCRPA7]EOO03940.1 hypothetical protein UCRPA7_456 [Phaeoacremonium minimum UCRPA7]
MSLLEISNLVDIAASPNIGIDNGNLASHLFIIIFFFVVVVVDILIFSFFFVLYLDLDYFAYFHNNQWDRYDDLYTGGDDYKHLRTHHATLS